MAIIVLPFFAAALKTMRVLGLPEKSSTAAATHPALLRASATLICI
jgi:hypothetical protein